MNLQRLSLMLTGIPLIIIGAIGVVLLARGDTVNARSAFAAAIIAASLAGASTIYQIKNWKLGLQSVVHFGVMLVTVLPALYLSGWFALDTFGDYLKVAGIFIFSGVVLWTVFALIFKVSESRARMKRERV